VLECDMKTHRRQYTAAFCNVGERHIRVLEAYSQRAHMYSHGCSYPYLI
jgi:hypothetical protein